MSNTDDKPALKITLEDLEKVSLPLSNVTTGSSAAAAGQARQYGTITAPGEAPIVADEGKSKIYLQGWFYLGSAGLLGGLAGWGICEPWFVDRGGIHWGNLFMMPGFLTLLCLGLGVAESIVERSGRKALWRALLVLPLGLVFGFLFDTIANTIFRIGVKICFDLGVQTFRNPALWVTRGLAWMVFGVAGGIVYGMVDRSSRKMRYGIFGGLIGAGLGGLLFDPISMLTGAGAPSRAVGFGLLGLATGVAI